MRFVGVAIIGCVVCITPVSTVRADPASVKAAQSAVSAWLALVDVGKYDASWDAAASLFRQAVPKETWRRQVGAVRKPLGAMVSRKPRSAQYTTRLPGAPDGKYVVIQLDTAFKNKRGAIETITPMLDRDGTWRVSGYFIK